MIGLKESCHLNMMVVGWIIVYFTKNNKGGLLMKQSRHFAVKVSLFLATILLVSFATTQIYAADYKLRVACSHKPVSPWVQAAQYFEKELEALTGGRIDVSVHHSATLGNTREVCEMVRNNTLEAAIPGSAQLSTYTPEIGLTVLAYIFKSDASMFGVLDGPIGDFIESRLAEANFHNLGWYKNGFRSVTNDKRAIQKLEDLNGLKLRVLPSPSVMAFFKEVGVNPGTSNFLMLALGPFFPEQVIFDKHKTFRDQMATYEYELANYLKTQGCNVLGSHHIGITVDNEILIDVKSQALNFISRP